MTVDVTLKVPDILYRRVEHIAHETRQDVADVLLEAVANAFPLFHVDENLPQMLREGAAFEAMHGELWAKYPQQYVAVHRGQVIDRDVDEIVLLERLDAKYPDDVVLVRQVLRQPQGELYYRSPRFVNDEP
jgi:hypothetical protein